MGTQLALAMMLLLWPSILVLSSQSSGVVLHPDIPTLRQLADKAGIFVGSASNVIHYKADSQYDKILAQQFSLTTAENACKWTHIRPYEGVFNFSDCDFIVETGHKNNQTVRGHNLCWGVHNPDWLNGYANNATALRSLLTAHVGKVAGHYVGKLYAWDVVNEAVLDGPHGDQPADYLKKNIWYPAVPDYIDVAFRTAHQADQDVKLFYNDYNCEVVNGKSSAIYGMVKSMLSRGIPIHGVGIQSHFKVTGDTDTPVAVSVDRDGNFASPVPTDWSSVGDNIKRFVDLGLEVHITELDVKLENGVTNASLKLQAEVYSNMLKACLQHAPKCRSFETWGFIDKYAYNAPGQEPDYFDKLYQAKPCFFAVANDLSSQGKVHSQTTSLP